MATSNYQLLYLQKQSIEKHYRCFTCKITGHGTMLVCTGSLQPLDWIEAYQIKLTQIPGNAPRVYVVNPKVEYNSKIHMYKEGNLCLYYPAEFIWKPNTSVATYMIPWINEWIIYYELYKISGVWEGPESPHMLLE